MIKTHCVYAYKCICAVIWKKGRRDVALSRALSAVGSARTNGSEAARKRKGLWVKR